MKTKHALMVMNARQQAKEVSEVEKGIYVAFYCENATPCIGDENQTVYYVRHENDVIPESAKILGRYQNGTRIS